jgi:hypothetical protein
VKHGGYLITFINNTLAVDKYKWRNQVLKGFNSILTKMKPEMERENFENVRKQLRKVNGLRKKARDKLLKGMDFTVNEEEVKEMWHFKPIAEWGQSLDFRVRENDQEARQIYGIVWQRIVNKTPTTQPSPSSPVLLADNDELMKAEEEKEKVVNNSMSKETNESLN